MDNKKVQKTSDEWRRELDPETFRVTREKGTEAAFSGRYWNEYASGTYRCSNCRQELFDSKTKFNSGTGWPSFDRALPGVVDLLPDNSLATPRTEVLCNRCGAHLGHVFPDGPKETTGERFCINSASIDLDREKNNE